MKKCVFTGCGTALVTPFHADGSVNYKRLESLVEEQINGGVDALIICGTTGESATLDHEEHVKVLECSVASAAGRVPIIAGTGSNDTAYALTLSKEAMAVGADALLMVTPYYNKTSQAGLVAHYNYIADRVDAPIILYNVPSRTGTNIKPETYAELAKHPNIVAAKEANGDLSSVAKTICLCGDELTVYSGNDDQVLPIMALGGKGVISVFSNICPKQTHDMVAEFLNGNIEKSREIMYRYLDIMDTLFIDVNPIPVKEAMNILGMDVGECRLPLVPMSDAGRKALTLSLENAGLL